MKTLKTHTAAKLLVLISAGLFSFFRVQGQSAMTNIDGRNTKNLDGEWKVIIDPTGVGEWRQLWTEKKPQKKTDFVEYSFDAGPTLHVPGDFNTQLPELTYVEGAVWYKKTFNYQKKVGNRLFIYFGAVNYLATVYLNGKLLGRHEGGFTPFQFEMTNDVQEGENSLVVKADNQRKKDGLPGLGYDWFNYGGITREVYLVETRKTYVEDYFIQLQKHSLSDVVGWVKINGPDAAQEIRIRIPELNINYTATSGKDGYAPVRFSAKFQLWSPESPRLYKVHIEAGEDTLTDDIGFRSIEVSGMKILLNKKPVFLKGIDIHEERPMEAAKAYSELMRWFCLHGPGI